MRKIIAIVNESGDDGRVAQGVIDLHSHIITTEFVSALEKENRLLDEGFPLPKWVAPQALTISLKKMQQYLTDEPDFAPYKDMILHKGYQHHIQTAHFQKYKQGTLHMVKSLKMQDFSPLSKETMNNIFKRQR